MTLVKSASFWSQLVVTILLAAALARPAHAGAAQASAQQAPPSPTPEDLMPKPPSPVERLGPNLLRVGTVQVDTAKKEVFVQGTVQEILTLEFIAVAKFGFKAYESALVLDTTAINFNVALILMGLDPDHGVVPKVHFDPNPPSGDPVELWVEWDDNGVRRRVRAEQLVYNRRTQQTLSEGPWVYTAGMRLPDGRYMWETEGTLISFVHTNAPLIESPRALVPGDYGENVINPSLNLKPGTNVTLIVRALPTK